MELGELSEPRAGYRIRALHDDSRFANDKYTGIIASFPGPRPASRRLQYRKVLSLRYARWNAD